MVPLHTCVYLHQQNPRLILFCKSAYALGCCAAQCQNGRTAATEPGGFGYGMHEDQQLEPALSVGLSARCCCLALVLLPGTVPLQGSRSSGSEGG